MILGSGRLKKDNDWLEMAIEEVLDGLIYSGAAILKYKRNKHMKFVVLTEYCVKESQTFLYFLQYTGNEEHIHKFNNMLNSLEQEKVGHLSVYSLCMSPVSLSTAEEMSTLSLDTVMGSPYIARGTFSGIPFEPTGDNEQDICELDEVLYRGKILNYFTVE